jgi:hypothetical protein
MKLRTRVLPAVIVAAVPLAIAATADSGGTSQLPRELSWRIVPEGPGTNPSTFTVGVDPAGNDHYSLVGRSCYILQESPLIRDCGPIQGNLEFVGNHVEIGMTTTDSHDKGTADTADDFSGTIEHHFILNRRTLSGTFRAAGSIRTGAQAPVDIFYSGRATRTRRRATLNP